MIADLSGRTALVTGGTGGTGLATALALGARGAACVMTYRRGSADADAIRQTWDRSGAPVAPTLIQADVGCDDDTERLMTTLRGRFDAIDIFVSNVPAALVIRGLEDYSRSSLHESLDRTAWPMVGYTQAIHRHFGRYPRYVIGRSSTGVDRFSSGYDFAAASKAVLESLCRYLNMRLSGHDVRVNVVRSVDVRMRAGTETFGPEFTAFAGRFLRDEHMAAPEEVANAIVGLCSGLMDGYSGQVLTVDRGVTFFDNLMRLYGERERLGLTPAEATRGC